MAARLVSPYPLVWSTGLARAAPIVYRSDRILERLRRQYIAAAGQAGVEYVVWGLESELGQRFAADHEEAAERILDCRAHLLTRYDECHGPGHEAGLVVMALSTSL